MGIIPPEKDGLMLALFDFALLNKPLLLRPDALKQDLSRFVCGGLGDKFALDGTLENGLFELLWKAYTKSTEYFLLYAVIIDEHIDTFDR